jgi:predicted ATPase/DNA-binding SARP family transcriptional activator/DNA-binding CsgD family transcriptional regulator
VAEGEWHLRKARSLVKLLALAPGHALHREQVMDLLWSHLGRRAASNNLRGSLHAARTALASGPVVASRYLASKEERIALCPEVELWVDVETFEEAASAARRSREPAAYRAAIELYVGELLPEDRYEEWAEGRRGELRRTYLAMLVELTGAYEERAEYDSAIEVLRKVVAEEPTSEEAHAGLMRLHALLGRKREALAQYVKLEEILLRELGTEPAASSRALRDEIAEGRFSHWKTPSLGSPSKNKPDAGKHNLPAARTSFVGREREIVEMKRELAMTRLLTLTGVGGSGKTRLALEVARDLVGAYADGVWLVELAPLSEERLVPQAVARTMRVREQPGRPLIDTLTEALHKKATLLVLDNCEHLAESVAHFVDTLLDSCSQLRVLTTSREPLGVEGEVLWRVSSLSTPNTDRLPTAGELTRYDAVRLFLDRARLRMPHFDLTPANTPTVAEVCTKLEGIPLAIELATARMGTLSVWQISEKLRNPLSLLSAGGRTAVPRQQTLRGTLDWSHDLLSESERTLFGRLSMFVGGWMLEAAEAVVAGDGIEKYAVLNLLSRLVDKSLVTAEIPRERGPRYTMLEPVRQYAQEKLEASGEAQAMKRAHAEYFLALAERAESELRGPRQQEWLERLEAEHGNLRAALSWALEGGEPELALRLSGALGDFWYLRGWVKEARGWLEVALEQGTELTTATRVKALVRAGTIAWEERDLERAVALSEEGLALSRELGDKEGAAAALFNLGVVAMLRNENERALVLFDEAIGLARDVENVTITSLSLQGIAFAFMQKHDFERAAALQRENLARARKTGDQQLLILSIGLGGLIALGEGDYERAEALGLKPLEVFRRMDQWHRILPVLQQLAAAAAGRGDLVRSARLSGASQTLRESMGARLSAGERAYFEPHLAAARAQLDNTTWEIAWAEGRAMTPEQAVEYALGTGRPAPAEIITPEQQSVDEQPDVPLTRREREVAELVGRGLTSRQIASELHISEHTVDKHVANILRKLNLHSREQVAVQMAKQRSHPF